MAGAVLLAAGCTSALLKNLTTNKDGNIEFLIINDTDFRASFSFGTYDSFDRDPPGPANLRQLRLEANTSSQVIAVTCLRNAVVGTQEFIDRVLALKLDQSTANFDADAFDDTVHFSDAPADSPLAAAPVAGSSVGSDKLLGVDYSCGDRLVFTLRRDPDAPGGFRIDYQLIQDE